MAKLEVEQGLQAWQGSQVFGSLFIQFGRVPNAYNWLLQENLVKHTVGSGISF